jgi:3-phenylpropionate/cinnamic acid dioxygenase small subunit
MADDQLHQLQQLQAQVQRLNDIEDIKQLKARYCQLVDAQEWDAWGKEVLTEDFHFESEAGVQDGRDVVVDMVGKSLAGGRTVHHVHSPIITITGLDTATGVWAMQDHVHMAFGDKKVAFRGAGHYREDYVRTLDGWRIKSTVLTRLSVDTIS